MKIKILKATLESYWYSNHIGYTFTVNYNIHDREDSYQHRAMGNYFRNDDVVITELPESFCVKKSDDKEKWGKYVKWLNKKYYFVITSDKAYPYYGKKGINDSIGEFTPFGTEIHIDDMIKHIDYMEPLLTIKVMKIKILKSSEQTYWYCDLIGDELEVNYCIEEERFPFRAVTSTRYIKNSDAVITELPESFCVKRCDENNRDDWNKYLVWLNKQKNYSIPVFGGVDRYKYYGVIGEKLHSDYLYPFGTEIHLDDMIKHIDYMESLSTVKNMKIKILKSDNRTTWYNDKINQVIDVNYDIKYARRCFTGKNGVHNLYNEDCVITELPESFCVKKSDDNQKWFKYLVWLVKQKNYSISMFGGVFVGVLDGVIGKKLHYDYLYPFGTEIHIDDMIKHIDYMESQQHIKGGEEFNKESQLTVNMNTQKISRQGLKEIYSVACDEWQGKIISFGYRNPLEDYIDLTEDEVNEMFFASNEKQKSILSKYLKQDDGSIGLSFINSKKLLEESYDIIGIIDNGDYSNKSFWLTNRYNWEIKKDNLGQLCLIPTKKK